MMQDAILITGGAGFIGSALVRYLITHTDYNLIVLDKLTYAGNVESFGEFESSDKLTFIQGDICDEILVSDILIKYQPIGIMHLAAESHVDNSIDNPLGFVHTNIVGTAVLLQCANKYYRGLSISQKNIFRFHHISTDEVYGSLPSEGLFSESSPYDPSSPYSASKASADYLVQAWFRTYGFPTVITNCSNNYGAYQYPEKLIPLIILNALDGRDLPVYGDGKQVRDWLYVDDHVKALYLVFCKGKLGQTYNIGGNNERQNIEVVNKICDLLDELVPKKNSYAKQIKYVGDRPGHDMRYAIDATKIKQDLHWQAEENFETGMRKTVKWYLQNLSWCKIIQSKNNCLLDRKGKL